MSDVRQNDMVTVIVRLAERILDLYHGLLPKSIDECPSKTQSSSSLGALLPALYDILNTMEQTSEKTECRNNKQSLFVHKLIKVSIQLIEHIQYNIWLWRVCGKAIMLFHDGT